MIIINNPGNPNGKVFTKAELLKIKAILDKWPNVVVVADEVYDNFIYDDNTFTRISSLPGMWDRTINCLSAGKLFSATGWRIGYGIGPSHLIKYLNGWGVWMHYCTNRPAAMATAAIFARASHPYKNKTNYYEWLNHTFEMKKNWIIDIFSRGSLGLKVLRPEGGYFLIASIRDAIKNMPIKYFYKDRS
jgi:aspartate/methionine/tyrosine aminotransferase